MAASPNSICAHFAGVLPAERILTSEADCKFYGKDSSKQFDGKAGLVVLPESELEIQQIISICREKKLALVPSGGRTGYSGGATAMHAEVVLSLDRMRKILEVRPTDQTLRCQAGATTEAVRQAAEQHGLFYPVDFASKGTAQIGGNIATNAGGIRVIRYGSTREWVLGLRAVDGNAAILDLNGSLYKNQSGFDLRSLLIGSEGCLAIVTEATLKLTAPPGPHALALVALSDSTQTISILSALRKAAWTVNIFEYFEQDSLDLVVEVHHKRRPFSSNNSSYALIEVALTLGHSEDNFRQFWEQQLGFGVVSDVICAQSPTQEKELMSLRELISDSINKKYVPHKNDISVPVPSIPQFVKAFQALLKDKFPKLQTITFGHIGDGNLHLNVLKPANMEAPEFFSLCDLCDQALFALVQRYRGSISAEHGVGLLKRDFLHFSRSQEEIALMRCIKKAFDPDNILNAGKVL